MLVVLCCAMLFVMHCVVVCCTVLFVMYCVVMYCVVLCCVVTLFSSCLLLLLQANHRARAAAVHEGVHQDVRGGRVGLP
mgnify:CR=1 FL=1